MLRNDESHNAMISFMYHRRDSTSRHILSLTLESSIKQRNKLCSSTDNNGPLSTRTQWWRRQWDVSYTSVVPWVEKVCITCMEERGPPGGSNVCNDRYHSNMSMNSEIRQQQSCTYLTLHTNTTRHKFIIFAKSVDGYMLLRFCSMATRLQRCRHKSRPRRHPSSSGIRIVLLDIKGGIQLTITTTNQ